MKAKRQGSEGPKKSTVGSMYGFAGQKARVPKGQKMTATKKKPGASTRPKPGGPVKPKPIRGR